MDTDELIKHAARLRTTLETADEDSWEGRRAQACEFLQSYGGPKNSFLEAMRGFVKTSASWGAPQASEVMKSFSDYVKSGLQSGISPERRAQLDVVSDFLEQASVLLNSKGVHPAAPAVLIGATLEEFLRTWIEAAGLSLGARKPGLESYARVLRESDLIKKQDAKDITSWAGIRNHAAHGEWDEVSDKKRIDLMLEGVNLFMRKYTE